MQFLAYIIVLAVSVSTILLELQWLTSPSRQPKPAVQATAVPVPRAKIDGPNVELSPVYPKPEVPRSVGSVTGSPPENAQASAGSDVKPQAAVPAPVETSAKAEPQQKTEPAQTADIDTRVEPKAETSGAAVAAPPSVAPEKTANAAPAAQPVAAKNSCDVQACARAYTSFSAADCTYQPFQGPRQLCVKPPAQAQAQAQAQVQRKSVSATREPNADVAREQSKRAEIGRAVQFLRGRRAVDEADFDEPMDVRGRDIMVRRPSWRW